MPKTLNICPLYASIAEELLRRIRNSYRPGDLLPTQQALAAEFDTSLITVKRALTELSRLGLIDSVRGRGTIVRSPIIADDHAGISSWTDSIGGLGADPHTAWIKLAVRVPPAEIGRLLGLRARQRTVVVERLRTADHTPMCLMTNEIPQHLAPDLAQRGLDRESLYACLAARYGLHPSAAQEEVTARLASPDEQTSLDMKEGIVLEIRRLTRTSKMIMELATLVAPVDRYRYCVTLQGKSGRVGGTQSVAKDFDGKLRKGRR